jgi:hypothetical protein
MKDPIEINVDRPELDVLGLALRCSHPTTAPCLILRQISPRKRARKPKERNERKALQGFCYVVKIVGE